MIPNISKSLIDLYCLKYKNHNKHNKIITPPIKPVNLIPINKECLKLYFVHSCLSTLCLGTVSQYLTCDEFI